MIKPEQATTNNNNLLSFKQEQATNSNLFLIIYISKKCFTIRTDCVIRAQVFIHSYSIKHILIKYRYSIK